MVKNLGPPGDPDRPDTRPPAWPDLPRELIGGRPASDTCRRHPVRSAAAERLRIRSGAIWMYLGRF